MLPAVGFLVGLALGGFAGGANAGEEEGQAGGGQPAAETAAQEQPTEQPVAEAEQEAIGSPWKKARTMPPPPSKKWHYNYVDREWNLVDAGASSSNEPPAEAQQWEPPENLDLRFCDCCEHYSYLRKKACVNINCASQLQNFFLNSRFGISFEQSICYLYTQGGVCNDLLYASTTT